MAAVLYFGMSYSNLRNMLHVDLADRMDSSYFQKYLTSRGLSDRIQTVWKTDQADKSKLSHFMRTMFDVPPNLIIDDASYLYEPTLASFEALFPLMPPGSLFVYYRRLGALARFHCSS